MNRIEKLIIKLAYITELEPTPSITQRIRQKIPLPEQTIVKHINNLIRNGQMKDDGEIKLTQAGRERIKVILIGGVFDIIHPGHIYTIKTASKLGDILVVAIARDSIAQKRNRKIFHNEMQRKELVEAIRFVDLVMIGNEVSLYNTVEIVRPDIIALGYDQIHKEYEIINACKQRNIKLNVIRLDSPFPGIKSTGIKDELQKFYKM